MRDFNVSALERILAAARTITDNRAGRSDGNARRTHGTTGCGGIRIHTIEVIKIAFTAVGRRPIVSVERHRRFGVADQVADIERIAEICFPPESVLTDALQDVFSVIDREGGQF